MRDYAVDIIADSEEDAIDIVKRGIPDAVEIKASRRVWSGSKPMYTVTFKCKTDLS
jgi:hypothetical protein